MGEEVLGVGPEQVAFLIWDEDASFRGPEMNSQSGLPGLELLDGFVELMSPVCFSVCM